MAVIGDRTLAVWIGAGFYHFTTYNTIGNVVNVINNVPYENNLEGVWTYLYYSYKQDEMTAKGYLKFSSRPNVVVAEITNIRHRPLDNVCSFQLGRQFISVGANGMIARLRVNLGHTSYVGSEENFLRIASENAMPLPASNQMFNVMVQ